MKKLTADQIKYQRDQRKISKLTEVKRYYEVIKNRKTITLDDNTNKKVENAYKKRESKRDRKTEQLVKNAGRKEAGKKEHEYKPTIKKITKTMMLKLLQKYVRLRDSDKE